MKYFSISLNSDEFAFVWRPRRVLEPTALLALIGIFARVLKTGVFEGLAPAAESVRPGQPVPFALCG